MLKTWPGVDGGRLGPARYSFGNSVIPGSAELNREPKVFALISPSLLALENTVTNPVRLDRCGLGLAEVFVLALIGVVVGVLLFFWEVVFLAGSGYGLAVKGRHQHCDDS